MFKGGRGSRVAQTHDRVTDSSIQMLRHLLHYDNKKDGCLCQPWWVAGTKVVSNPRGLFQSADNSMQRQSFFLPLLYDLFPTDILQCMRSIPLFIPMLNQRPSLLCP